MGTFARKLVLFLGSWVIALGIAIYAVDPYHKFHDRLFGVSLPRILDPALIRHFIASKPCVLVGSSMIQNFRASAFKEAFGLETMKRPLAGGTLFEQRCLMEYAFLQGNPRLVVWSLDLFAARGKPSRVHSEHAFPGYLYHDHARSALSYALDKTMWPKLRRDLSLSVSTAFGFV